MNTHPDADADVDASRPMTFRQESFINHYLGDARGNGSKAARLAGYSPHTAAETAYDNLRIPHIRSHARAMLDEHAATAAQVMATLKRHIEVPIEDFFHAGRDCKITAADQVRACELMLKFYHLLTDDVNLTHEEVKRIEIVSIEAVPVTRGHSLLPAGTESAGSE